MAKKPKADINDIRKMAEILLKTLNSNKKFRDATKSKATSTIRKAAELRKNDSSLPSSALKPKIKPTPKAKPKAEPKKVKPSEVPSIGESGTRSRKPSKLSTPKRPVRDKYPKGKTLAQTASEQRAAERMGNRILRQSGSMPSKPRNVGSSKPVDVRGSVITPPSKATMRPSKPSASSYEADKLTAQARADRRSMGTGQKPFKPPKDKGTGGAKTKPKPKKPSGSGGATKTAKKLREELANASSAAERAAAQKRLMNHLLTTGGRRSKNIYK